jgi:DNA topoisomerase IB
MVRKSYVHPLLVTLHKEGRYDAPVWAKWAKKKPKAGLHKSESTLLNWLERTGAV